jgi:GH15 family glucan-1,4-alpha-glucosidase
VTVTPSSGAAGSADAQDGLPIAEYGLLSDCSSASLVSRSGSIDWLCLPRFDSPAVFARILDPRAGHWSIRPAHSYRAERRYLPGSLAIETTFTTDAGTVRLLDVMASRPGQRGHDHGLDPPHEVLRLVEGVSGRVEFAMELAPRPARSSAQALFDRLAGCANDLRLLAEEIDTQRGELLGNFPQAFSHVGLINAAWDIDQARTAASPA